MFITQHASIISPLIVSALKLILFIVLIIKALRTTRNIKHAGIRAVTKYFLSFNHCSGSTSPCFVIQHVLQCVFDFAFFILLNCKFLFLSPQPHLSFILLLFPIYGVSGRVSFRLQIPPVRPLTYAKLLANHVAVNTHQALIVPAWLVVLPHHLLYTSRAQTCTFIFFFGLAILKYV